MDRHTIRAVSEALNDIVEAYSLNRQNQVYHDAEAAEFAKHYVKGHKGEHTPGAPSPKHEQDAEEFHNTYDSKHVRTGFGGSGTSVYTHKKTGQKFEVTRRANGKGFDGTDHNIRAIPA
jgi:hypothetical protein